MYTELHTCHGMNEAIIISIFDHTALTYLVTLIRRAYIEKYIVDSDSSHKLPDSGILAYFSCSNFS